MPEYLLSELLKRAEDTVKIQSDQEYVLVTVRLWGNGIVERSRISGLKLKTEKMNRVHPLQFLLSRIDARNGAFGIIPESLEGAVVTNDFPVFTIDASKILPKYLDFLSKTDGFVNHCVKSSEGTTNRVRLKIEAFLKMKIDLPHLDKQEQIINQLTTYQSNFENILAIQESNKRYINKLWESILAGAFQPNKSKVVDEDAKELLLKIEAERKKEKLMNYNNIHPTKTIIYEEIDKIPNNWVWTDFGSILTHIIDCINDTPIFLDTPSNFIGLKSSNIRPYELDLKKNWYLSQDDYNYWNRRIKPQIGDILLTREAPMGNACILDTDKNLCLTQRIMLLRSNQNYVLNKYILHYINSPLFTGQITNLSRGLTAPHIRVKDVPFIKIPLCPLKEQQMIVEELDRIYRIIAEIKKDMSSNNQYLKNTKNTIIRQLLRARIL
jgi:type I restriction enzyme, S subunit